MESQNYPSLSSADRKRQYSTIGIHDVFLSPIAQEQLPQSYYSHNTSGSSRSFVSPEIVGSIKAEPEDFIVRELASKKLGLSPEWRVADLRTVGPTVSEMANSTPTVTSFTVEQGEVIQEGLDLEKELGPLEVVQRVLQTRHPETFQEELLALHHLQEQAMQILKEQALDNAPKSETTNNILWIPPVPVDVSCFSPAEAAPTKRLVGGGDRGSLHRCLKQAFPLLQSESKKRNNSSDTDSWIKVEVDESFFGLTPYVFSPAHERIRDFYKFRKQGVPSATQATNKDHDANRMKRKRSNDRNSAYPEDDPFQFLLPLRVGLSKDERRKVHHLISGQTRDFETRTISDYRPTTHVNIAADDSATVETTSALALTWSKNARRAVCKTSRSKSCLLFVLKKRGKEHLTAIQLLTQALRCRQRDIGMAGIKDMYAVTYQYFTLRGQNGDRVVSRANDALADKEMKIASVSKVDHFLQPGDTEGNHFEIVVRNAKRIQAKIDSDCVEEERISCDREHILARSEAVRKCGFVNFYGEQRVGIAGEMDVVGVRSFDIGRAMLQRDFDKAIDLLMTGRLICRGLDEQENPQARKARQVWKETNGNVDETYKALPKGDSLARERTVLQGLKRYQSSLDAFKCLHFQVRTFWINAYQSYIWNKMASVRLETYGSKVVVGDLLRGDDGGIVVVTADLVSAARFCEVVLPLPGYNVQYPTNDIGRRYEEILLEESVKFEKDSPLEATAKGSYRRLMVEMDSLQVAFPGPPSLNSAESFQISFDLPPGSYATMLLRELMVTTVSRL
jgi:TruD family tRNA pseudouridine synthase